MFACNMVVPVDINCDTFSLVSMPTWAYIKVVDEDSAVHMLLMKMVVVCDPSRFCTRWSSPDSSSESMGVEPIQGTQGIEWVDVLLQILEWGSMVDKCRMRPCSNSCSGSVRFRLRAFIGSGLQGNSILKLVSHKNIYSYCLGWC